MAFFTQLPAEPGLAELLGKGISKGLETGLTARLKRQEAAITPYQALSTQLRAQEQRQKTERGVMQSVTALADPLRGGFLKQEDVAPVTKSVTDLINQGMNPTEALAEGIQEYRFQETALQDINVEKYSPKKAKSQKENILRNLRENEITNPTLINRALAEKKWPVRERKDILKNLKGIRRKEIPEKAKRLTPKLIDAFLRKAKGNPDRAAEMARRAGYEVD